MTIMNPEVYSDLMNSSTNLDYGNLFEGKKFRHLLNMLLATPLSLVKFCISFFTFVFFKLCSGLRRYCITVFCCARPEKIKQNFG